jgi:hypothetical protein
MSKNNNKDPLTEEQRKQLNGLHNTQITLEISLTIFILSFLTINMSSAFPGYAIVALLAIGLTGLLIFICGIILTVSISSMKRQQSPIVKDSIYVRRWITTAWLSFPLICFFFVLSVNPENAENAIVYLILTGTMALAMVTAIICVLVNIHMIWRRFNRKKRSPTRIISYGIIAISLLLLTLLGSYTTTEAIKYSSTPVTDSNLELGQTEVRQIGKDGQKRIKHNLILGTPLSTDTTEPTDEIVAKGSRRYQYMYCSDGSYYYYTAEQFKNLNVGYTHQSPDVCAQKGTGTQTTIADVPPAEKIVQQVPTYRSPIYRSPTYTTCTESYLGNSFTCSSY